MAALLLLSLLLLLSSIPLQAQQNFTRGSSLTPQGTTTSWLSPSGDFAFGFRPIEGNTSFYLFAVWFNKISDKTVAWYAKTTDPDPAPVQVSSGSRLQLNSNGMLSLQDSAGTEVWNPQVADVSYAAMLDSGNFVLAAADGYTTWESFQYPTDTILLTQVLTVGKSLRSRILPTDYSNGRFLLHLQSTGVFLYTVDVSSGNNYDPYWSMAVSTTDLVFNATAVIYIGNQQSEITSAGITISSIADYYHRATLDHDGVFRQYMYPKKASKQSSQAQAWSVVDFKPPNICEAQLTSVGSGICGFNSYCVWDDAKNQSTCMCPEQYSYIDEERKYKGCKADFQPQSCDLDQAASIAQFKLTLMRHVDWPLSDYEQYRPITKDQCQTRCLTDCFCSLAVFHDENRTCWKKKMPLSNGNMGDGVQRSVFLKVPSNPSHPNAQPPVSATANNNIKAILGATIGGIIGIVLVIIVATLYLQRMKMYQEIDEAFHFDQLPGMPAMFSHEKLRECTEDFSHKLGEGGFGSVFEGKLNEERVAVKRLESARQGKKEFLAEIETIGSIEHMNLVRLVGFCVEKAHRLLVYEYMPRGSLDKWIYYCHNNAPLDWCTRRRIIFDIAKGLCYLHEECRRKIAHLDIKPQNILLDENFNAKLADFGLSKLIDRDQTNVMTVMRGTPGYLAPEWLTSQITEKVDIYSFGVVVMEVICGRRNIDNSQPEESMHLINLLQEKARNNQLSDMIDKQCDDMASHKDDIFQMMRLGMWCLQNDSNRRPLMSTVVKVLEGTMIVETCINYNFFGADLVLSVQDSQSKYSDSSSASVLSGTRRDVLVMSRRMATSMSCTLQTCNCFSALSCF